ncbi:Probable galacturonosyltransferase 6 [Linum grandiflorum]
MKAVSRRRQRILILCFLSVSVLAPIVFLSNGGSFFSSFGRKGFAHDISNLKYRADTLKLHAIEEEADEGLKEPQRIVYKQKELRSIVRLATVNVNSVSMLRSTDDINDLRKPVSTEEKAILPSSKRNPKDQSTRPATQRESDVKIKEMQDKIIQARAYISLTPPGSNSHLVKELKLRIKELERYSSRVTKDADLHRSALQKLKAMDFTLFKAGRIYKDCNAMAKKLRAMTYTAEEQVQAHKNEATYLLRLAARSTPKGYHCLSLRLTSEYFALSPEERQFPNQQRLDDPSLHHYAVFSDNILASAVVVNSTVSSVQDSAKVVFHVVTNSLNFPAISMWFLSYPPGNATIHVQSIENLEGLSANNYSSILKKQNSSDPRYTSELNHLRFYLPDLFPKLNKVVLLDHDVVVRRDLAGLWDLDLEGKVNGAVGTCHDDGDPSFRRMEMLINFSDPYVARNFNARACTWAFGMNLFDLKEWRRQDLTSVYHHYLRLGSKRPMWKSGSLPLGWATFYNSTVAIDKRWHRLGLGYESGVKVDDVAAVLHYDGVMKPWLDIGISKYKGYWTAFLNYENPHFQQCNIHQ